MIPTIRKGKREAGFTLRVDVAIFDLSLCDEFLAVNPTGGAATG